ncbi:MAG: hypothetical protein K2X94_01815 [Amoebophilaceae bacterium]|nr:hypothetical protein [Amoebophilaceae bacterium]
MKYFLLLLCCIGLLTGTCKDIQPPHTDEHPIWNYLNEKEEDLPEDKSIITKLGFQRMRFHVTAQQQCLTPTLIPPDKNIVQITENETKDLVLTPSRYGAVTLEKFPKTLKDRMPYRYGHKTGGMPASFLEELLAIDPDNAQEAIVVIATGIKGYLGISKELEEALQEKKKRGVIKDYIVVKTAHAVNYYNKYVKEGKKVFAFIHTAG